jgi:hypothetical protein
MRAALVFATVFGLPSLAGATPPELAAWERARVQAHLDGALERLAERDLASLAPAQRAARAARIEALRAYRDAGRFPKNHRVGARVPIFVDAEGTRCAMAHLIASTGRPEDQALVEAVARARNLATISELADTPRLLAWLETHGLTVAEAAAIQPAYTFCSSRAELVCPATPARAAARATLVERTGEGGPARFVLEEVLFASEAGAASVGDEVRAHAGRARPEEIEEALVVFADRYNYYALGIDDDGRVFPASDPCDTGLTLGLEEVLDLVRDPACIDRLDARDPAWASGFCAHLNRELEIQCGQADLGALQIGARPEAPPSGDAPSEAPEPLGCRAAAGRAFGLGLLLGLGVLFGRRRA